ncbi:MAG: hypothetical protein ACJAW3_000885 [Lentimonas sp.]|jgi:hypothetical protein
MQDKIGYDTIIENSMRNIIFEVLRKIEKGSLESGHHFIINFDTEASGVVLSESLKIRFPSEMTIVVQHQFSSLVVKKDQFQISLSFSGIMEELTIPYRAITSFADPYVNFGLKFNNSEEDEDDLGELGLESESAESPVIETSSKIISLAEFRKNRNKKP